MTAFPAASEMIWGIVMCGSTLVCSVMVCEYSSMVSCIFLMQLFSCIDWMFDHMIVSVSVSIWIVFVVCSVVGCGVRCCSCFAFCFVTLFFHGLRPEAESLLRFSRYKK